MVKRKEWKDFSRKEKIICTTVLLLIIFGIFSAILDENQNTSNKSNLIETPNSDEFKCYQCKEIRTKGSTFWFKEFGSGSNCMIKGWDNLDHLIDDTKVFCSQYCCNEYAK